jgi:hypothetical protein
MQKTTVYLPSNLKRALRRLARERKSSEAALLRQAVARLTEEESAPEPRLPLVRGRGRSVAERVDDVLGTGFGRS